MNVETTARAMTRTDRETYLRAAGWRICRPCGARTDRCIRPGEDDHDHDRDHDSLSLAQAIRACLTEELLEMIGTVVS